MAPADRICSTEGIKDELILLAVGSTSELETDDYRTSRRPYERRLDTDKLSLKSLSDADCDRHRERSTGDNRTACQMPAKAVKERGRWSSRSAHRGISGRGR